jgi:hypothetical protein
VLAPRKLVTSLPAAKTMCRMLLPDDRPFGTMPVALGLYDRHRAELMAEHLKCGYVEELYLEGSGEGVTFVREARRPVPP